MLVLAALCAALAAFPSPAAARALPGTWYRERDEHPVHRLFSRQTTTPQVGSTEWRSKYPTGDLRTADIPQAWLDALKTAEDAGLIPDIPPSTSPGVYPAVNGRRLDPAGSVICSSSVQCETDQIYDVPDGVVAISFDDGPLPAGRALYKFLRDNNQKVTHFFIGQNILANPQIFLEAFNDNGNDIAVHTWSHPQMTTLSNEMVLAELGWTMQIIHDSTGGRLPRFWRPSFGDSDNRVRAIAKQIFGLTTVIWNDDTDDWQIETGDQTVSGAKAVLSRAYRGPKSPGLNILEHELSADCVKVFVDTYPLIAANGWTAKSIPDAMGTSWYLNAADNTSPVSERPVYGGPNGTVPAPAPASTTASASAEASATPSSPSNQTGNSGSGSSNGAVSVRAAGWTVLSALVVAAFAL